MRQACWRAEQGGAGAGRAGQGKAGRAPAPPACTACQLVISSAQAGAPSPRPCPTISFFLLPVFDPCRFFEDYKKNENKEVVVGERRGMLEVGVGCVGCMRWGGGMRTWPCRLPSGGAPASPAAAGRPWSAESFLGCEEAKKIINEGIQSYEDEFVPKRKR